MPEVTTLSTLKIPLGLLKIKINNLKTEGKIIVFCRSGNRSLKAAQILEEKFTDKEIYSLTGGIEGWIKHTEKN